MRFNEIIEIIKNSLGEMGHKLDSERYDGILVKKLTSSNTLDEGRSTNQTHIAITGEQMGIFPYLRSDNYFNKNIRDQKLKKYFITEIDVSISEENLNYLKGEKENSENYINSTTTVTRSVRSDATEQIQISLIKFDGEEFINFRKLLHQGDYLIILKLKNEFLYEFYGIKEEDEDDKLRSLNNKFVYRETNTLVNTDKFISDSNNNYVPREKGAKNILLYGVPGSGKSHTINTQYCNDETKIERVVFHPDYMNTDFIGQILPTIKEDGMITYEFTSGPFTKILKRAYEDPSNMYYLVIEEINRGNAPAIFGEVFQLLDRDKYGNSTYGITNENVAKIVYGNANRLISLPSNLWILATMNTADQNVFTLDTAFQRRWIMRMIKNDIEGAKHADTEILDTGVTWKMFAETINNQIIQSNSATMSSEDKRLGAYFITDETLIEDKENINKDNFNSLFAEKVIKYLWDDAFKFGRDKLFNLEYKSLERIIEEFSNSGGFKRFDILETSIKDILKNKSEIYKEQDVIEEDEDSKNIVEE